MNINIIGINTLHCHENRDHQVKYKKNRVKVSATPDIAMELKLKLTSTGVVTDIGQLQNETDSQNRPSDIDVESKVKFIAVINLMSTFIMQTLKLNH